MKRSILLLGGSRQQVIAIKKAKELGYHTVLCDYLPDNPGQHEADVFYQESTTNREKILEIARRENASGILAYSSDPASATAGFVSEKLGLPSNPLAAIEILSEKHLFRQFLHENGFPCPACVSFDACEDPSAIGELLSELTYPIVIKPTDSSGSKGVCYVNSVDGVQEALLNAGGFSRNGILIAEEFIKRSLPFVVGGDIFVVEGHIEFWGLMPCLRDERLGGMVPIGKYLPAPIPYEVYSKIKELLQDLVDALSIQFGEFNVEIIVGENSVPFVLELGSRAGGNMIPVQLSDASGIDLVSANVQAAMGELSGDVAWDALDTEIGYATHVIHSGKKGRLKRIEIDPVVKSHIYRRIDYVSAGDDVEVFDGANKALGILFLQFNDVESMHDIIPRLSDLVTPVVE